MRKTAPMRKGRSLKCVIFMRVASPLITNSYCGFWYMTMFYCGTSSERAGVYAPAFRRGAGPEGPAPRVRAWNERPITHTLCASDRDRRRGRPAGRSSRRNTSVIRSGPGARARPRDALTLGVPEMGREAAREWSQQVAGGRRRSQANADGEESERERERRRGDGSMSTTRSATRSATHGWS